MANQRLAIPAHMTVEVVEGIMGLSGGSVTPMIWLMLQEEAAGTHLAVLAQSLGVELEDMQALKEAATGLTGDDCERVWQRGVVALKTAFAMNQNVGRTWDAVESMAVEKLANSLSTMKGNGNAAEMLAIATAANRAARRNRGESGGSQRPSTQIAIAAGVGSSVELASGKLGTINLRLAPAIQNQLSNPTRVIDHVSNQEQKKIGDFQMLGLKDTRNLVQEKSSLDQKQPDPNMTFDSGVFDE